jgi:ABC-type iron transport system FetAB ATPase subunit
MPSTAPVSSQISLRLRAVAVATGGRKLLSGIDLDLSAGERVALRGPSGCGKTTLLRAITGLVDPVAGEVETAGHRPGDPTWPLYRRRTILVEQRPVLLLGTVRENLARPFLYHTADSPFPVDRAIALLSRMQLVPVHLDQEARSLSQGEQQRVCLARALLLQPQVLLLDEPTSALDEDALAAVEDVVREESDRRALAALIITHTRAQADRWCHRIFDLLPYIVDGSGRQKKADS